MRVLERGHAVDELVAGLHQPFAPLLLGRKDGVLVRLDAREVGARGPDFDPEAGGQRVDVVGEPGRDEVGLRRAAGDVRAASAPAFALDHRDVGAVLLRRAFRTDASGRAGPDHDQVERLGRHLSSGSGVWTGASWRQNLS
jgi:hypothetical protein